MPWISVASTTRAHQRRQQLSCRLPMTLSIRYLVESGSTSPLTRLITISTKPTARMPRRGRIISRMSGHSSRKRSDWLLLRLLLHLGTDASLSLASTHARDSHSWCHSFQCSLKSMAQLFAGTSGFAYPTWKPDFYPAKARCKKIF